MTKNISNKLSTSKLIGDDDDMMISFKDKSIMGAKSPQLPQINQNNSFEVDSVYNQSNMKDSLGLPELNEHSKFVKFNNN